MKKLSLLLVALLCLSAVARAGEVISNDTGEDATGLRVSFSTPVLITAFGDILTSVDPQLLSFDFVFSGGVVEPWGNHWMNWAPATASVMQYEWLTGLSGARASDNTATSTSSASSVNWEDIPRTISYPRDPFIEYYCDGDEDLANAQFWNNSGSEVEALRLSMTDSSLLLGVELYSGNSLDYYDYVISFYLPSRDRIALWRTPSQDQLTVSYFPQSSDDVLIHVAEGAEYREETDAFYGVIPLNAVLEYASRSELCNASIELNLFHTEGNRREVFVFSTPTRNSLSTSTVPAISKSYEEIMAEIAQYPGPDEPIYIPAEDEAIWLTDLEGHADIYDNDSIQLNYASWFDSSQITNVEVYRNGVKLGFLPDMLDVLTNDQMKAFDGNPLEYSPVSNHADHAIFGYTFEIVVYHGALSDMHTSRIVIQSPVVVPEGYRFVNLFLWNNAEFSESLTDDQLLESLMHFKQQGWDGISLDYWLFPDSQFANNLDAYYTRVPSVTGGLHTATETELRRILMSASAVGLDTEVRVSMHVSEVYKAQDPECGTGCRSELAPVDIDAFFANYTAYCVELALVLEDEQADVFTVMVEADSLERYGNHVEDLLDIVSSEFSGRVAVNQATNNFLNEYGRCDTSALKEILDLATFWDWQDDSGRGVDILMSGNHQGLETRTDQRFSHMVEQAYAKWNYIVDYYRSLYPGNRLAFGELGVLNRDGSAQRGHIPRDEFYSLPLDLQEEADQVAAILIALQALGMDGFSYLYDYLYWPTAYLYPDKELSPTMTTGNAPVRRVVASFMGGQSRAGRIPSVGAGILEYSQTVAPQAKLDWEAVLLSRTTSWGLPGGDVKFVGATVSSGELLIDLELHTDGLTSGNFKAYALDLRLPSGDHVYVSLIPEDRSAILEYYDGTTNQYVGTVSGNRISVSPQRMSAKILISEFQSLVSEAEFCSATFSFLLEAFPGNHHEIFWFPGQASVNCQQ